jgi:dihydrofolate reductase
MELIVAMDINRGIAKQGGIPWHIPADLRFFKQKTIGHVVIMGRKTFDSLPNGRPLKNRLNIVLTSQPPRMNLYNDNCIFTDDFEWVRTFQPNPIEYPYLVENCIKFIIGGAQVYQLALPLCTKWWVTRILQDYECDVQFPIEPIGSSELVEKTDVFEIRCFCYR